MLFSPSFLGLFSEKLVEEQPLDDDGLAGQESRGRDGGGRGSSSQDKTTWEGDIHDEVLSNNTSAFAFFLHSSNLIGSHT